MSRWLTFYRCPQCGRKQAYLGHGTGDTISVDCRSPHCLDAVIERVPGEPVEATLRRAHDAWAEKLAAKLARARLGEGEA